MFFSNPNLQSDYKLKYPTLSMYSVLVLLLLLVTGSTLTTKPVQQDSFQFSFNTITDNNLENFLLKQNNINLSKSSFVQFLPERQDINTYQISFFCGEDITYNIKHNVVDTLFIELNLIPKDFLEILIAQKNKKEPNILFSYEKTIRSLQVKNIVYTPFSLITITDNKAVILFKQESEFDIHYSFEIPQVDFVNEVEKPFFSSVVNWKKKDALRKYFYKSFKKENTILTANNKTLVNEETWYNPDIQYYKIEVDKNAIVQINFSDLLPVAPEFNNQPTNLLRLISNGKDYPFYIKSADNLISKDDKLIFYGLKAKGDSTENDFYTNTQLYFIYLGKTEQNFGLSLKEYKETGNQTSNIDNFIANFRFEKDSVFGHGQDYAGVDHSFGEFWYWDLLYTISHKNFNNSVKIYSDYESLYPSAIGIDYKNFTYSNRDTQKNLTILNNLTFNFNNINSESKKFEGLIYDTLKMSLPSNHFKLGDNYINFIADYTLPPKRYENNIDTLDGIIGVDAVLFSGSVKPIVNNGAICLQKSKRTEDNNYTIDGFSNSNIIFIDSVNNQISFPKTKSGYSIISSTNTATQNLQASVSIEIRGVQGDSKYLSTNAGFHFIFIENNKLQSFYSPTITSSILQDYLNKSLLVLAINSNSPLTNDQINLLKQVGSIEIEKTNDSNYSYLAVIQNRTVVSEQSKQNTTNLYSFVPSNTSQFVNNYQALLLNKKNTIEKFIISDSTQIISPTIHKVEKSDLRNTHHQADLIIITHKNFLDGANQYANYRAAKNNIKTIVIDKEDIYKEFSYGKESPKAIKDFLHFAYNNWTGNKVSYLTIIGDASWDPLQRLQSSKSINWVPVYGWPTTDVWYTLLEDNDKYSQTIGVGRISANTNDEVLQYLSKIKEYENVKTSQWMSNIINISGGIPNSAEIEEFYNKKDLWLNEFSRNNLCFDTINIKKKENVVVGNNQGGEVRGAINKGAFWVSYLGHAAAKVYDLDGWEVSTLNNKGKYPILTSLSCNTGAFAEPENKYSRGEEYVLTPNRGFIVSLASTFTGFATEASFMQTRMFTAMSRNDLLMRNISDIFNYGKNNLVTPNQSGQISPRGIDLFYQNNLLGDPLINVKIGETYDLFINSQDLQCINSSGNTDFSEQDSVAKIYLPIYNNGYKIQNKFIIKITDNYESENKEYFIEKGGFCLSELLEFDLDIKGQIGKHKLTITVNSDNSIPESDFTNNTLEYHFTVFKNALLIVEPQENWQVEANNPQFIYVNPLTITRSIYDFDYSFSINEIQVNNEEKQVYSSTLQKDKDEIQVKQNKIIYSPKTVLDENKFYVIYSKYTDNSEPNKETHYLRTPFTAKKGMSDFVQLNPILGTDSLSLSNDKYYNTILDSNKVTLSHSTYTYDIIGARGDNTPDIPRYILVEYKDEQSGAETVFQDGFNELGFHVLKFPAINNIPNFQQPVYRYYNTWGSTTHPNFTAHNELAKFLQDSIGNDEYLFVVTMGEASRMPVEWPAKDRGNIDSLRKIFADFGSKSFDNYAWGYTFAFGMKKTGNEIKVLHDSCALYIPIEMKGNIEQAKAEGSYTTAEVPFLRTLQSVKYNAISQVEFSQINLSSTFTNDSDSIISTAQALSENTNNNTFELTPGILSAINSTSGKINQMNLQFKLNRENSYSYPALSNLLIEFLPSNEIAISRSKTRLDSNFYLRGYNAKLYFTLENLSNRFEADNIFAKLTITNSNGNTEQVLNLGKLKSGEEKEYSAIIPTEFLANTNSVLIELSDKNGNTHFNEMYNFNNSTSITLNVKEDNEKPTIKLYADYISIKDKDFVQKHPKFIVDLYDNSPLDFQGQHIQFLLNRYLIRTEICSEFDYKNYINSGENGKKSTLEFVWEQQLDFGENSISVRAFDQSGNRADTIEIMVFVSRDGKIKNVLSYPNPATESSNIKYYIQSPITQMNAEILIYDALGNFVKRIEDTPKIGENTVFWDLTNENGQSISNGVYYYFIQVHSSIYFDGESGVIIISK